jgi:predicted phage tail protein
MGSYKEITGAKGGAETPPAPVQAPDSLISKAYARVLDLISEGPIAGLVNGNQSIFLNKTPLANADGSLNFSGVTVGTRTGEADQDYLPGFPSVETETGFNIPLKAATPWVQAFSNLELSAVRIRLAVPVLTSTDNSGNVSGFEVKYAIDVATDSGAYVEVLSTSFNGKTTKNYERSHRVELPAATTGWRVRVRRLTPDSTNANIQCNTQIVSYTEIIDAKLRYPYTALVGITVDASQFQDIPTRAFDCKLRIIQVPSNYDPESRIYTGVWDGTFKLAWTDNPVWIYYDLILNDRYGLGQLITAAQVDKWGLYQIARYCDEPVSDGKEGTEPRFVCNLYLQTQADALQVLQDLASIFRGMAYWAAGSITASADMPSDPVYTYNQANVIGGAFTYAGSSRSTRYSVALVDWNDPADAYAQKVEYVSDQESLKRYGVRQTHVVAFGCTSQGQAQRLGHYTLLTNRLETEAVTFSVGLDGTIARPGQVIRIADPDRAGRRIGGRIKASTANSVTLDADSMVAVGNSLSVILPTGVAETRTVASVEGRVVTVSPNWTNPPVAQSVFAIESADLVPQTFRVLSVAEDFSDSKLSYNIKAIQHVPEKYAAIDNGAQIVQMPVTVIPTSVQPPPTNIALSTYNAIDQGIARTTMRVEWDAPKGAVSYDVWWRRNNNDWVYAGRTYSANIEVRGIYAGTYLVRVAALNALNAASLWAYSDQTDLQGKTALPPAVTSLTANSLLFGIGLNWNFPEGADDTQRTEIWYGPTAVLEAATKLSDLAYPQRDYVMQNLRAGASFFFWARLVDRTGNIGPWYPIGNGVLGQASSDAGPILDLIAGEIGKTQLGQDLLSEIDKIDGLQDQIDALSDILAYDPEKTYQPGDSVRLGQRLYQAAISVPANSPPPNASYWLDIGQVVETANGLAEQVELNTADISDLDGVIAAQASSLQALRASFRDNNGEGDLADALKGWSSAASIAEESQVRAAQNLASAQQLLTLTATVGDNAATVTDLKQAVATDKEATAQQITQLSAKVGDNTAAIQTTATAYADTSDKLSTMWSVKMQVNANGQYVAAGIGLGIENTAEGFQSQFLVSADRFAVVNGVDGSLSSPFAVQGGQVFINSAFIKSGSIGMLQIGAYLQSDNYVANTSGWQLTSAGVMTLNGVGANTRRVMSGAYDRYYNIANGVLVIEIGELT